MRERPHLDTHASPVKIPLRPAPESDAALRAVIRALARQAARELFGKVTSETSDGAN